MSDTTTTENDPQGSAPPPAAPTNDTPTNGHAPPPVDTDEVKGLKAAVTAERRKRQQLEADLDKLKSAQMSEAEKAVAEAKAEGRKSALAEVSTRLLAAEVRAAAADRMADPADAIHLLDLDGLVDDDGTVDSKAVASRIEDLLKDKPYLGRAAGAKPPPKAPQGARDDGAGNNPKADGDAFIRRAVARRRSG